MSNEREVWIASALVNDMSVDLFAWRLEQDWERIGAGRLMFPAKDDQRPEYDRTWLTLADIGAMNLPTNKKGWPISGTGRVQATQRTLSSIGVRVTGDEDLVIAVYDWCSQMTKQRPAGRTRDNWNQRAIDRIISGMSEDQARQLWEAEYQRATGMNFTYSPEPIQTYWRKNVMYQPEVKKARAAND